MAALLSTIEAAAELKISVKTLRGHVKDGAIRYIVTGRGTKRLMIAFDPADILLFQYEQAGGRPSVLIEPAPEPEPTKNPRRRRAQKVYFIRRGDVVKIGIAADPKTRLGTLQVAHHERLELLLVLEGGERRERRLHSRFNEYALAGEWFRYEGKLKDYIDRFVGGKQ